MYKSSQYFMVVHLEQEASNQSSEISNIMHKLILLPDFKIVSQYHDQNHKKKV